MSICPRTGLGVPECSCPQCVEELLRRVHPELLAGEIRALLPLSASHSGTSPARQQVA